MCTSFAVHLDKTFIGMNFDISRRPIKIILLGEDQLLVLQNDGGQFYPAFGLNSSGTFMNLLMVDPIEEVNYRRGKNCVHIMMLFDELLSGRIKLSGLKDYLDNNAIVNVPNHSVHSMIAGKNRETYIVEPGRNNLNINSSNRDFMVLTNFPLSDNIDNDYRNVKGPGNDRYIKAYESITNGKEIFNIATGFNLLKETVQQSGDYPTQLSMIFTPEESKVYFTLNGYFTKVFEFSFITNQVQSLEGFISNNSLMLSKKGVLLSELEGWE
ncbi:hypothetical protein [Paenibacillus antarcticus]|uniref:Choloylglycine hydrolase/NAAA C-terminal domain-containing protein n=1 Tax=Paenibacillus antarcticus TaxID=253703 RepID=A0A168KQI6_9BACL|nr:hypothetical protein [Paenibacillus antarcticus]OAB42334.1 hypothetical protein PBAT_20255 [Paenibacillus antarcticus]